MVEAGQYGNTPLRVLLVDDEAGYVDVLRKRMTRRGIEACAATSGRESIRILRQREFDVAVLDLKMEDMDGIEVLKIFRMMAPEMPVIILTGHGSEQDARDSLRHGAAVYLTKPCEMEELLEKIGAVLQERRGETDRNAGDQAETHCK